MGSSQKWKQMDIKKIKQVLLSHEQNRHSLTKYCTNFIVLKLRGRLVCDFKSKDANLITTPLQNHTTIQDPQKKGLKLETTEPKRME